MAWHWKPAINRWKDDDGIMNIWKSYLWTAKWRINWRKIIAVIYATFAVAKRPAPSWLVSLIGRALYRYRRGQGFESRTLARIFSGVPFRICKSCVYNCNDLPLNNSSLRISHIWFSYIHNFITSTDNYFCNSVMSLFKFSLVQLFTLTGNMAYTLSFNSRHVTYIKGDSPSCHYVVGPESLFLGYTNKCFCLDLQVWFLYPAPSFSVLHVLFQVFLLKIDHSTFSF